MDELPQLVLFHNKIPMLMKGTDIRRPDETLDWIVKRQSGSSIMEVTDEILSDLGRYVFSAAVGQIFDSFEGCFTTYLD